MKAFELLEKMNNAPAAHNDYEFNFVCLTKDYENKASLGVLDKSTGM